MRGICEGWRKITVTSILLLFTGCIVGTGINVIPEGNFALHSEDALDYYVHENDSTTAGETELQRLNQFRDRIAEDWDFYPNERIQYYKFNSRDDLRHLTGEAVNGRAIIRERVVHSIHPADAHELAHVVTIYPVLRDTNTSSINISNFWLEGIAMYYSWPSVYYSDRTEEIGFWLGSPVHHYAKTLLGEEELPELSPMIYGNSAFNGHGDEISYPIAGSFVTFLLGEGHQDQQGIASLRTFLKQANTSSSEQDVQSAFQQNLGMTISEAERNWHTFLNNWSE